MDQETLQKSLETAAQAKNGAIEVAANDADSGGNGEANDGKTAAAATEDENGGEKVEFKVIYNKKKFDVSFPLDKDVAALKQHLQSVIDIPPAMMKIMIKGLAKDDMTLRSLSVSKSSKVMVIGSSLNDVLSVSATPTPAQLKEEEKAAKAKAESSSSREKMHKKGRSIQFAFREQHISACAYSNGAA